MKKTLIVVLSALLPLMAWAQTKPTAGNGTPDNPYQIATAEQLVWFQELINGNSSKGAEPNTGACAKLTANIDLSQVCSPTKGGWVAIGLNGAHPYKGTFDGQGHTISNLYADWDDEKPGSWGLFNYVDGATLKNVRFNNVTIAHPNSSAALVFTASNCEISDIVLEGQVRGLWFYGIAANIDHATLSRCANYSNLSRATCERYVDGPMGFGGIAGHTREVKVTDCVFDGTVTMDYAHDVTGLVADAQVSVEISNCLVGGSFNLAKSTKEPSEYQYVQSLFAYVNGTSPNVLVKNCFVDERFSVTYGGEAVSQENVLGSLLYGPVQNMEYNMYARAYWASASDLSSGKIAFMLQDGREESVWGQTLSSQAKPVLGGKQVYVNSGSLNCAGMPKAGSTFTNTVKPAPAMDSHVANGDRCGKCFKTFLPEKGADDWYEVGDAFELNALVRFQVNPRPMPYKIRLTADIDLSPICNETLGGWMPIGVDSDSPFTGTFDGQGHTIKGLYLDNASGFTCGFFGNIKDAEIKNVKFDGTTIVSNSTGAVCVASARGNSHIADVEVMGDITAKNTFGVIAQTVYDNTILERCVNRAHFTNTTDSNCSFAGIVLGMLNSSIVRDCMYLGSAKMQNTVGMAGLALSLGGDSRLENCLSAGSLEADSSPIPFEYAADQIFGLIHFGQGSVLRCFADVRSNVVFNGHKLTQDELSLSYNTAEPIPGEPGGSESFASASDLSSGKVAFLLQNGREETVWGQTIGKDEMPVLGGAPVYCAPYLNCQGVPAEELGYKLGNEGVSVTEKYHGDGHFFGEDGFCKYCHTLMAPETDEQGRHLIANLGNLLWFRDYVEKTYPQGYNVLQTADIDLSSVCHPASETQPAANWKPILNPGVYGTYDGGGHTITGLYINDPAGADAPYASFFGYIGYNGAYYTDGKITRIKNLTIEGDITSGIDCAIFGGGGHLAFFENCTSRGTINYNAITPQSNVAGILGKGKNCTFTDCHNEASITAVSQQQTYNFYAGVAIQGIFERCTNTGDITITAGYAGGITCSTVNGNPDGTAAEFCIKNCSNTGNITAICDTEHGVGYAAAITGRVTSETPIVNCWYSCNLVQDATAIPAQNRIIFGALYGPKSNMDLTPVVTNCYYNNNKQVATSSVATGYTNIHFRNGHVAALLGEPWGQNIDMDSSSPRDEFPVLGSYPVYMLSNTRFSNFSPFDLNKDGHITVADLTQKIKADEQAGIKAVTEELKAIIDLILERGE